MIQKLTNLSNVAVVRRAAFNVGTQCIDGARMTEIKSEGVAWELLKEDTPSLASDTLAISIKLEVIVLGVHLMPINALTNLELIASI